MIYTEDPQLILFNNRTRTPTLEELTEQVNVLARIAISANDFSDRIATLEAVYSQLAVSTIADKQTRSLNTDFVIDAARDALVFYTIELTATRILTGTDTAVTDLCVNGDSVCTVKNLLSVVLALGVNITNTHQKVLMGFVPRGGTVNLTSSGTATFINGVELLL